MKTDHMDLYQMHHIDRHTLWEEIWQVMGQLVRERKPINIGSSNFVGWDIATAQSVAESRFLGLASSRTSTISALAPSNWRSSLRFFTTGFVCFHGVQLAWGYWAGP